MKVAETQIKNVFYCKACDNMQSEDTDTLNCKKCEKRMELTGWFEHGNDCE